MQNVKPLGLAVAMGLTLDVAGSQHVYGLEDAKGANREVITAAILLAVALLWLFARPQDAEDDHVPFWIAALPAAAAMISITDIMTFIDPGWTTGRALLFGGGCAALLALAVRRAPGLAIAAVALVFGVILRSINMRYIPIEPSRGDMLPLVQQALTNFLDGRSPYAFYMMPWILPLTYFPLTWLAYLPAHLFGFDFRWINVGAEVAVLGAAMFVARHARGRRSSAGGAAFILWGWLFLSPTVVHWDLTTTAPIGWAAIAWALALVVAGRQRMAPVALGVAAATTPFIAVFMLFIALNWWRSEGLSVTIARLARAALVAGLLLLPFFAWAPQPFLDGTVRWFNDLERFPRIKWRTERTWGDITGFSGMLWQWRLERWLKPIQLGTTLLVAAIYAWRGARRSDLLAHATAAFLLFMLFNPVLWPYLYNPALVAALLAAGGALPEPARAAAAAVVQDERPARRPAERYPSSTT